jgi:hypothetical protein
VRFLKSLFDLLLCGGYARWVWVLSSGEVGGCKVEEILEESWSRL